jgi:uncharacterized protein DUF748
MNRKRKIQIGILTCLAIYSLVGFIVIPLTVKSMLPEKLGAALNREVFLKDVRLNPYTLYLTLEGLEVKKKNSKEDFVSFNRLLVNIQTTSLFKMALVIKEIKLEKPFIGIDRVSDTRFNFSDLIKEGVEKEKTKAESQPSEPFQFELSNIQIVDGRVNVWDDVIKKAHSIDDISFNVPFLSNFKKHHDTHTKPGFTIQLNNASIAANISTKPFADSLETILDIKIKGIRLPHYFDYAPKDLGFKIINGKVDIDSKIFFTKTKNKEMSSRTSGTVNVHDLEIVDSDKNAMIRLPKLAVVFAPSKFLKKDVRVESITISRPEIDIRRYESGDINLFSMGQSPKKENDGEKIPAGQKSTETQEPFRLVVEDLKMDSSWVRFRDDYIGKTASKKQPEPVQIAMGPITLAVQDFSTDQNSKGNFDFKTRLNEKGDIAANGKFGIFPLSVDTHFDFKDVVFTWIEPYLQSNVHLAITNGRFSSSGDLTLQQNNTEGLSATLKGDASIEEVVTVDKIYAEDFASLKGFYLKKMDISYNPMRIELGEIRLNGWKNRLVLHEDGNLNLSKILVSKNSSENGSTIERKKKKPSEESIIPVKVNTVFMQNIHMDFIDQQIKPYFSSNLTISEAKITGLTSKKFKEADVVIKGKIDDYAPVGVTGKINPLQENLFADMAFSLKGMELTTLTPYSGKYIGNTIEKGKLSIDLTCLIKEKELKADDKILFDQLALGKTVDSPDSLKLPVGLAISLLKDRSGQINLDVPVSGRLDDPEFSMGGVIVQTLINIVEKAATSPFTLIGGVAGGGEELQFIEFNAGHEEINDGSSKKLDSIITLLYERPGLNLGIAGYVDPDKDRAALSDMIFHRKIKAQKRLAMIQNGMSSPSLEEIEVSTDEYEEYLRLAYTADTSVEPGHEITIQEMEKKIKEKVVVKDTELKLLALNRAKEVKSYILKENTIEPNRLFLTEAKALTPEQQNNYSASRVELSLQ